MIYRSLYDIGYATLGKSAIYMVASIISIFCNGLLIIYFILFGKISQSLVAQMFFNDEGEKNNFMTRNKTFHVLVLGMCLLPVFMQKHLKELTIISIILFFGVACFVVIISAQLLVYGEFANPDEDH